MSEPKKPSKEQLLKAIKKLEENPKDRIGIFADIGVGVVGAGAAAGAVAAFGGTSILFGLVTLAPPVGLVVGGAALIGLKKIFLDGTFTEGKQAQLLAQLKEQLKDAESKERASKVVTSDKDRFVILLKEPIEYGLLSPEKAQQLISAVESGNLPLTDAYKLVKDLVESGTTRLK